MHHRMYLQLRLSNLENSNSTTFFFKQGASLNGISVSILEEQTYRARPDWYTIVFCKENRLL